MEILLLDGEERETTRYEHQTDGRCELNQLAELPHEPDLYLVCAIEPGEPPFEERVTCVCVGYTDDMRRLPT